MYRRDISRAVLVIQADDAIAKTIFLLELALALLLFGFAHMCFIYFLPSGRFRVQKILRIYGQYITNRSVDVGRFYISFLANAGLKSLPAGTCCVCAACDSPIEYLEVMTITGHLKLDEITRHRGASTA